MSCLQNGVILPGMALRGRHIANAAVAVNLFACLQLCAATPNAMIIETVRGFCEGYYRDVVAEAVPVRDGRAVLTGFGAGLGVSLRPEFLAGPGVMRRVSASGQSS